MVRCKKILVFRERGFEALVFSLAVYGSTLCYLSLQGFATGEPRSSVMPYTEATLHFQGISYELEQWENWK